MAESGAGTAPRWLGVAIGAAAAGLLISLAGLVVVSSARSDGAGEADAWRADAGLAEMRVPDFRLVDQHGRPVDHSILDGRITILDFIFTHCPVYCPQMSARMMFLSRYLEGTGVRFLSISIDPEHDTPERLREFAARYEADHDRWAFLTGEPSVVTTIGREMGFAVQQNDESRIPLGDGSTMSNLIHPTSLLLVGPDRRVLGRYSYRFEEEIDALAERARKLAAALERGG